MRRGVLLVLLAIYGCASPPASAPPAKGSPPPSAELVPPPVAPVDSCGAAQHQHLVGRPRADIPVPLRPERQRVACDSCPITEDYSAQRLNFFFDAGTGRITKISCG